MSFLILPRLLEKGTNGVATGAAAPADRGRQPPLGVRPVAERLMSAAILAACPGSAQRARYVPKAHRM